MLEYKNIDTYYVNATKILEFRNSSLKSKNSEPVPSPGKYLPHSTSNGYLTKSYSITGLEYNGRGNTLPRSHQKHDLNKHLLEGTSEMSVSISTIPHEPNGDNITAGHKAKSSSVSQVRNRQRNIPHLKMLLTKMPFLHTGSYVSY